MIREVIKVIIGDGQRAYRLKMDISDCPDFNDPLHKKAWKAGWKSAIHRKSVDETFDTFMKELKE